jgi:DNA processing protein
MNLTDDLFFKYLQLVRSTGISYGQLKNALARDGIDDVYAAFSKNKIFDNEKAIQKELEEAHRLNAFYIFPDEFPENLRQITSSPLCLMGIGNKKLLQKKIISIVGGRNASILGRKFTHDLSLSLGLKGWGICSGFAKGIDAAAHKGALKSGTIAVFAGGLLNIYPKENERLYAEILDNGGLIISEMSPATKPLNTLFPRRNRIVAALCEKLILVEASLKSGSMITAKLALDMNKDIFCVPGNPLDPRIAGCHRLIQNGAMLLHDVNDIDQLLPQHVIKYQQKLMPFTPPTRPEKSAHHNEVLDSNANHENMYGGADLSKDSQIILDSLSTVPMTLDDLALNTDLTPDILMNLLTSLEIDQLVMRTFDGKVYRSF